MADHDTRSLVDRFGGDIAAFLVAADRTKYHSTLFDMRKRTLLGMYCLYDHAEWYLEQIVTRRDPRELGASLRRLAARPYTPLVNTMPWAFLASRENDILLGRDTNEQALARVMQIWREVAQGYRGDGTLLPSEAGFVNHVLPDGDVLRLHQLLASTTHDFALTQRVAARLEIMNFVISGEIRGRNFFHGPYPGTRPGTTVIVQEFTELRHREQPWIEGLLDFPVQNVVIIREVQDFKATFDLFGFMVVLSNNYPQSIERSTVLTVESGGPRILDESEIEALGHPAQEAVRGAYARIAAWDDSFRIMYGVYHYLNEVAPFAEAVDAPELIGELRSRMEQSGHQRIGEVKEMGATPPVWAKWGRGGAPFELPRPPSAAVPHSRNFARRLVV